ncbi:hypothetical protein G4G27_22080 [Sphingomonas sp. So64.6b]|nr:hypothetical protein G4G27_22080 [Sphingomonas sp. So64.6b]
MTPVRTKRHSKPRSPLTVRYRWPLILPPKPQRLRNIIESGASEAGVDLNIVVEATGTLTVLELVRKRIGYTILPSLLVREECSEGRLADRATGHLDPPVRRHVNAAPANACGQGRPRRNEANLCRELGQGRLKRRDPEGADMS